MRKTICFLIIFLVVISCNQKESKKAIFQENIHDIIRATQIKEMKWGMFICWSFSTFSGQERTPTTDKDATYFQATGCNTDQWCKTAKDAEANYKGYLIAEFTYPILPPHERGGMWFYSLPKYDKLCHSSEKLYEDYLELYSMGIFFQLI